MIYNWEARRWNFNAKEIDKEHLYRIAWGPLPNDKGKAGLWTGEIRNPKEGEYYIDGKELIVYESLWDMKVARAIAKIVTVKKYEHYVIESD
jgi:hypothetical protein